MIKAICLASLLLVSFGAAAQNTRTGSRAEKFPYTRTVWRVADGLPEDTVQTLTGSADGRLWIGTTGGLVRFDGAAMEVQRGEASRPVTADSIFCTTYGRDGSLWAGTEGGGLLRVRGRDIKIYSTAEGLTDGFVRSVFEDDRSRLWVGTDDGLFLMEGARLRRVDQAPRMRPMAVHSITEDNEHRIWVGGARLIAINPDGSIQEFSLPGRYSQNRVKRVLQTRDGTLWVGTVGGLQRFSAGQFHKVEGIHSTVRSLLETRDGTLWIGTIGDGLWTLAHGSLRHLDLQNLLPSETVLAIYQDDQQQIWIGTQAGLVRLNKTPVSMVALPESGDPDFETISGDGRGNIWLAAQQLYVIRNGVAKAVHYGLPGNVSIRNVYRARDGALWIGTDGSGAYRIQGALITHFTAPSQLTNNFIRGFMEARDGSIWIGADEGVNRIDSKGVHKLTEADGLAFFSTRSLLEDRNGNIWIGTELGLSRWTNGTFRQDEVTHALAQEKIWSILEDRQGALWFGTRDHGLYRLRNGKLTQFTTLEGLPSNSIYQILQDRTGRFWITGSNTIASLPEAAMEAENPSRDQPFAVEVYSMPFGAEHAQLYGGRQPAGYLAQDGSVWFPTSRGAANIAGTEMPALPAPRASLESMTEDGRTFVPHNGMKVPAATARMSFAFTAVSLRSQEGVRFRYKLEGFDTAWNVLGNVPAANRSATYTNLHAGPYRFRVQAFDTADPGNVSEVDQAVVKLPLFYQTWWFFLLCAVALAMVAWLIYQGRVRRIRQRFAAVLEERMRLAREIHDTVLQGCTGISSLLEAMATTSNGQEATRDDLLEYARVQARTTINEAREAIWNMRHEDEREVEMVGAVRTIATQTSRESGIDVSVTANRETVPLGASVAHEVLMAVREAVYNAVQHAHAEKITIGFHSKDHDLTLLIADGGRGFSLEEKREGHYGILGMRERMRRLGGELEITSAPGVGTAVRLSMPLGQTALQ